MNKLARFVVLLLFFFAIGAHPALTQGAGDALSFNPADVQYAEMDDFVLTPSNGFAIECWVNIAGINPLAGGYQMFVGNNTANYRLGVDTNYHPYVNFGDRTDREDTAFTFSLDTWYHYAIVGYQNSDDTLRAHVYVNGVLIFSTQSSSTSYAQCNILRIAASEGNHFANGTIDEVRFWNGPRTTQQIRENMHLTVPGNSTGLVGYWRFDEGSGSSSVDLSGNGNTAELLNGPQWVISTAALGSGASGAATAYGALPGTIKSPGGKGGDLRASGVGTLTIPGTGATLTVYEILPMDTATWVVTRINANAAGSVPSYPGLNTVYPNYWIVEEYGASKWYGSISFAFNSTTLSSSDSSLPSNLKLFNRSSTSIGAWTFLDSASNAEDDNLSFYFPENDTNYSVGQYMIGTIGNSPLPIEALGLTATRVSDGIELQWETISEVDNYGFYVQRRDGINLTYATVSGLVPGNGTTLASHNYSWVDIAVSPGTYHYRLQQVDLDGTTSYTAEQLVIVSAVTSVKKTASNLPRQFALHQNYPNPFNPSTLIGYDVPQQARVSIKIYNILGEEVRTVVNGLEGPGYKTASFDASELPGGVYFYRLRTGAFSDVKKMLVIK